MSAQPVKYRITADQYERMGEAGVFHTDARLELLEGSIDESGEDYLYVAAAFEIISLPPHIARRLATTYT